jgi:signal transduction histidine kinase/HAMP domain-containing protein
MTWRRRWQRLADRWFVFAGQRVTLALKLALPVLVTTAILAGAVAVTVTREVQSQVQRAYEQQAAAVASGVEAMYLGHPDDLAELNAYLVSLVRSQPDLVSARIHRLDAGTTVIASSNPAEVGRWGLANAAQRQAIWEGNFFQDENDRDILSTVHPLKDGNLVIGAVVIRSSKSREYAATRSVALTIAAVALVAISIESVLMLSVLYFAIIRHTRRIQRAVEAVGRGDTSMRLPEGREVRGSDEIFNLARSVDMMIQSLDGRLRGENLIRRLGQRALEGTPTSSLIAEGLKGTRETLRLEACIFATVNENGTMESWLDSAGARHSPLTLPSWVFALTRVAVEARHSVVSDRLGERSRLAEGPGVVLDAQALIVPLPRTSKAGQAIIAIASAGETIPDGGLAVLDAVAATISESLHMQEAENARAESAVKSKVMAAVSHEMRNPLNSILGFTGLVLGAPDASLSDKQRRQLGYVQLSANNMLTLVNNYLDLEKVRAGSLALQYERVKVATLVNEVTGAMQPQAEAKRVIVRTSVDPAAEARTDPTRMRQVLINLVSNAIKFTPAGGRVFVRAKVTDGHLRVAVSDTGVGIPRDQRKLLFTEFAKIDAGSMAAAKGSGLGLALTQAFVAAMGGTITVYSRRGRGTTFVVAVTSGAGVQAAA